MQKLLLILTAFISVFSAQSQIVTGNTLTPAQLVSNILVGAGVSVSNVTFNGSAANAATIQPNALDFTANNFPFSNGLYLRTAGGASVASDPDLNAITTNTITNGAILEFDFVPMGDSLVFNYMFASAEYPTYVCSGFNDVFGFFISGPGFAGPFSLGAVNIAIVPGTSIPVSINTVNSGVAGGAGNPATCAAQDPNWQSNSVFYTTIYANYSGAGFNGGTVALPALAQLICGQTYHIKLAVSNVGDTALDSGVYIEGGSFATNTVEVAVATVTGDTVVYEGCSTADLMFIRPTNQTADTLIIDYDISGTATEGTDYNNIPNPVTFLPGQDTVIISINPIADGVSDNNEFIIITAYTVTTCGDTIISIGTLYILDELLIDIVETDPTVLCASDSVPVSAVVNDPNNYLFPPFSYAWTGGQVGQNAYFPSTPPMTGTIDYYVTVTNSCGYTAVDTVTITLNQTLVVDSLTTIPADGCGNPNGVVFGYASGMTLAPGQQPLYHWDDQPNWQGGGSGGSFYDANTWTNISPGWYYFTVTDNVCSAVDSVLLGQINPPIAEFTATPIAGCNPVSVTITNTSQNASTYYWDFGDGTSATTTNMDPISITYSQTSTIQLIASQNANCTDLTSQLILVQQCGCTDPNATNYDPNANFDNGSCYYPIPAVVAPNVFTPNGDGENDIFYLTTENAVRVDMVIVNRWGNQMYEVSYNPADFINTLVPGLGYGWNGNSAAGSEAENGTYFIKYTVAGIDGTEVDGHGFLQLVRD